MFLMRWVDSTYCWLRNSSRLQDSAADGRMGTVVFWGRTQAEQGGACWTSEEKAKKVDQLNPTGGCQGQNKEDAPLRIGTTRKIFQSKWIQSMSLQQPCVVRLTKQNQELLPAIDISRTVSAKEQPDERSVGGYNCRFRRDALDRLTHVPISYSHVRSTLTKECNHVYNRPVGQGSGPRLYAPTRMHKPCATMSSSINAMRPMIPWQISSKAWVG
jgi:hypothetical protein